ncbi:MAG: B12-binding domain-containing protein [Planctomycetota bacterium]|nr:B12-binding domain-containing protein [Planctomycetota bacterium]
MRTNFAISQLPTRQIQNVQYDHSMENKYYTPKTLGDAIGVSQSSLKRWADRGLLNVERTVGGHRRIVLEEALRFIRESGVSIVKPDLLGLEDYEIDAQGQDLDSADKLYYALHAGDETGVRGLVLNQYLEGRPLHEIFDQDLQPAMTRIGLLWHDDVSGITIEHRAHDICMQVLADLRFRLPKVFTKGIAIGCSAPGDSYSMPTALVSTALRAEGFEAINLGPNLPLEALMDECKKVKPVLVWISISHLKKAHILRNDLRDFARFLRDQQGALVIGGSQVSRLRLDKDPFVLIGKNIHELVSISRGLVAERMTGEKTQETKSEE